MNLLNIKTGAFFIMTAMLVVLSCSGDGELETSATLKVENASGIIVSNLVVDEQAYSGDLNDGEITPDFEIGTGSIHVGFTFDGNNMIVSLNWLSEGGEYRLLFQAGDIYIITEKSPANSYGQESRAGISLVSSTPVGP